MTLRNHRWDVTPAEAIALQREMRTQVVPHPPQGFTPRYIAGADVSVDQSGRAAAGIVVLDQHSLETVEEASARVTLTFPYVPGLLSFREIPAVSSVWQQLKTKPDVLIYDGVGYAHPRRFGIASHIGVVFDIPTIGCAKSILVGKYGPLSETRGSTAPLMHRGEIVGMAVRTRDHVQPVYVSIGHQMDLGTAVDIVLSVTTRYREPETTRRAHRLVNRIRQEGVSLSS